MHTGVRSAATGDPGFVIGDPAKRILDTSLHRGLLKLDLPAQESTTIIFQSQCISHIALKMSRACQRLPGRSDPASDNKLLEHFLHFVGFGLLFI